MREYSSAKFITFIIIFVLYYFIKILAVWQELLPYAVTKYIPKGRHFASITVEFSPLVLADATAIPAELKMVMLLTDSQ